MPTLYTTEAFDKERPLIFLYGDSPLIPPLIHKYQDEFKIVVLAAEKNPDWNASHLYHISTSSSYLIDKLVEKLHYGIFIIGSKKDSHYLPHILKKAEKDNTKMAILIPYTLIEVYKDFITRYKDKYTISFFILGELFGDSIPHSYSRSSKIIRKAIINKKMPLTEQDHNSLYPISQTDSIRIINHVLFSKNKSHNFFYLFYKTPASYAEALHLLKRVEPDMEITIDRAHEAQNEVVSRKTLEDQIKKTFFVIPEYLDQYVEGFEKSVEKLDKRSIIPPEKFFVKAAEKLSTKKNVSSFKTTLMVLTAGVVFFSLLNGIFFALGLLFFKNSLSSLENINISKSYAESSQSQKYLSLSEPFISILPFLSPHLKFIKDANTYLILITKDLISLKASSSGIETSQLSKTLGDSMYLYLKIEEYQTRRLPQNVMKTINKITQNENKKILTLFPILPTFLGFYNDKTYLLLFQNSGELRPTGGFIGSIGELSISKGKITNLLIQDVYEGDGQLKTHVEPHYIIRRYLQPHLYLRDSNFSLNFEDSASMSALLYNLELNKKVDGVIAIDFQVLQEIIQELGPIKLPEYKKTLDNTNTFNFLQETIEAKFFPGSTQKKDVLTSLFNQITAVIDKNPQQMYKIMRLLPRLLQEKHLLIASPDPGIQGVINANGFSGSYTDPRPHTPAVVQDFVAFNEANIGVNKANILVKRDVEYEVFLTEENPILSKATLTLANNMKGAVDYRSYVRLIVPSGSTLSSITINGQEQSMVPAVTDFKRYELPSFKKPEGLEVDTTQENNHEVYGFISLIPAGSIQKIVVQYVNGTKNISGPLIPYSLLTIKQPGTLEYKFKAVINYPKGYSPQNIAEKASFENSRVIFGNTIRGDTQYSLTLKK